MEVGQDVVEEGLISVGSWVRYWIL